MAEELFNGTAHPQDILVKLRGNEVFVVNSRRKNGLIIYKTHHAEFAGPGAVVGSVFDTDVTAILPVGNWSIVPPQNAAEQQRAYLMRRQWLKLFKQVTEKVDPLQRVQTILNQFENWFDADTVNLLPDRAIAHLVGVLPMTVREVRRKGEW
ncbi:hypothetical protein PN462_04950 [Spirulina sp. CS-785/01]|uniref:hypothetical protein n=1 Tax=Spirulina sp. CS-785/01 TaxID=3021716 RepID=UPI00232BFD40|nr:hypothetical protein [Spirulina sp. CS-785/01]MDB9312444.1 hypothetical protein [Spirulina sp. CS-785/01]